MSQSSTKVEINYTFGNHTFTRNSSKVSVFQYYEDKRPAVPNIAKEDSLGSHKIMAREDGLSDGNGIWYQKSGMVPEGILSPRGR